MFCINALVKQFRCLWSHNKIGYHQLNIGIQLFSCFTQMYYLIAKVNWLWCIMVPYNLDMCSIIQHILSLQTSSSLKYRQPLNVCEMKTFKHVFVSSKYVCTTGVNCQVYTLNKGPLFNQSCPSSNARNIGFKIMINYLFNSNNI